MARGGGGLVERSRALTMERRVDRPNHRRPPRSERGERRGQRRVRNAIRAGPGEESGDAIDDDLGSGDELRVVDDEDADPGPRGEPGAGASE